MPEKIIFEFRVTENEGGCGVEFRSGDKSFTVPGPDFSAWCRDGGSDEVHYHGPPKWSRRRTDEARHHMRETLDFLEQMYGDLFGEEDSTEIGSQ